MDVFLHFCGNGFPFSGKKGDIFIHKSATLEVHKHKVNILVTVTNSLDDLYLICILKHDVYTNVLSPYFHRKVVHFIRFKCIKKLSLNLTGLYATLRITFFRQKMLILLNFYMSSKTKVCNDIFTTIYSAI